MPPVTAAWTRLRSFCGFGDEASYLWPRWLVLRGVGIVFVIIFSGILQESAGLVGPHGLRSIADYTALAGNVLPNFIERFLRVPSFFLVASNPAFISALEWCGLVAAIALVLNLWPRLALFACWAILLSFVATWREFTSTLNDAMMLETALLCIPFAPSGFRPGLGTASPPRPIVVLMIRWLIIRIMLTAGLAKVLGGDPRWLHFNFMENMYETSPAPTVLGYYVFHLPHVYHVFEILFTYVAEIVVPVIAIFGGRRGRAWAVAIWTVFQLGIQLTGNFAWLNTAAIALGLLLLDDQMIASALRWLRLGALAERLTTVAHPVTFARGKRFLVLGALLWIHFALSIYFPAAIFRGTMSPGPPDPLSNPVQFLFRDFRSANCYALYASTPAQRLDVEFAGSNDGGATWRSYPFRYKPQSEDRMSPFLAPRFGRFEATVQLVIDGDPKAPLIADVARELVRGNKDVIALFASNPFPEAPPKTIRMIVYHFTYTNLQTHRETGRYWTKEYVGDYAPPVTADSP